MHSMLAVPRAWAPGVQAVSAVDAWVAADAVVAGADGRPRQAKAMQIVKKAGRRTSARDWARAFASLVLGVFVATGAIAASSQKTFASPEDAASALVRAVKSHDRAATLSVLGDAGAWLSSGDVTADRAAAERFVTAYETKHAIARDGEKATLTIGEDRFPFAFPIVKTGDRWRFDTAAGTEELLARRIGANELDTVKVLQAIVDAEREYASQDRTGDGVFTYTQKFESAPGRHDGLYWPTKAGEAQSPLGPLIARAAAEGYRKSDKGPTPYHGYYFRMLKGQGKNAEMGAFDYVLHGRDIGGFAVVAYPAKYGNSGIMTFIVNQDGKVYQSDLGSGTAKKASAMQRFDPVSGWSTVKAP